MPHTKGSTLEAKSIEEFVQHFIKFPLRGFYARGESKEYDSPFLPGIWRKDHIFTDRTPVDSSSFFTRGEMKSLEKCQERFLKGDIDDTYFEKFIDDPSAPIKTDSVDMLHWAALAQHYNKDQCHPTRLIDITRDPFVALYFAVSGHPDKSGFVYYFKDNFNEIYPNTILKQGGTFLDILEVSEPGDKHPRTPSDETLAVAQTPFPNRRSEAQRGAFCWMRKTETECYKGSLIIEIPSDSKQEILIGLERLNYDNSFLYPR